MSGGAPPAPYRPVRGVRTHPGRAAYRAGRGAGLRRPSQCAAVRSWPLVPGTRHMCVQGRGGRASDQTLFSLPPRNDPIPTGEGSNGHLWRSTARGGVRLFCAVFRGGAPRTFFHGGRAGCGAAGGSCLAGAGWCTPVSRFTGGGAGRGVRGTGGGAGRDGGRGCRTASRLSRRRTARGRRGMWPVRRVSRAARRGRVATSPSRHVSGTATRRGIFHGAWCGTRRRVVRTRRRGRGRRGVTA